MGESNVVDKTVTIVGRQIGRNFPPYIIAELSANHNGKIELALESIEIAKKMGADAIKLQTFTPDTITINCKKEDFVVRGGLWDGYSLYELYEKAHTPYEWHQELFDKAKEVGITIFSTPFDTTAVDLLEGLDVPAYKVASFELVDIPLIKYIANTKKPMIMSTGMASLEEIKEAVEAAYANGCKDLILLHCVSAYPALAEQLNLQTLVDLRDQFNLIVGLSDHTLGNTVPIASIAFGACFIEKHFNLRRDDNGLDSAFSMEPNELKSLCLEAKTAWQAIGSVQYGCTEAEKTSKVFRRSIYFVKSMKAGEKITKEHIRVIRPGYGILPKYYDQIMGKYVTVDVEVGTPVVWDKVE